MFKSLKKKLLTIIMLLLSTVIITIFSIILFTISSNMNSDIDKELHILMTENKLTGKKPKMFNSIVVDFNTNKEIFKVYLQAHFDESHLEDLVSDTLSLNKTNGKIKFDNVQYSFLYDLTPTGSRLVLIDRSNSNSVVFQLIRTLISVGILSLIALFFISIYLTNKAIEPIIETFEKQKQFIADASHELRTPLTIIKTNTSLILSNPNDSVKNQSKWINYIVSQTDRMSELISEMLSLAKLDSSENTLNLVPINISNIINSMLLGFEAVIFERDINLKTKIDNDIIINGDNESVKKLFSILIDNAIKHTNKKGSITVSLFTEKNKLKLIVKNTGKGIPEEDLDKIFERFYRVDSSRVRETGGYGLGLSIAKSIVNEHKGKIYAKSVENEYASFIVELPH